MAIIDETYILKTYAFAQETAKELGFRLSVEDATGIYHLHIEREDLASKYEPGVVFPFTSIDGVVGWLGGFVVGERFRAQPDVPREEDNGSTEDIEDPESIPQ